VLLVALALVGIGCASSGRPETLVDQAGPIDEALVGALEPGVDPDRVPLFQRNFLETCVLEDGAKQLLSDVDQVQADGLLAVCRCLYTEFTASFEAEAEGSLEEGYTEQELAEATFDNWEQLDNNFRDDDDFTLPARLEGIAADCIREAA
jgi:hypothetical protein